MDWTELPQNLQHSGDKFERQKIIVVILTESETKLSSNQIDPYLSVTLATLFNLTVLLFPHL